MCNVKRIITLLTSLKQIVLSYMSAMNILGKYLDIIFDHTPSTQMCMYLNGECANRTIFVVKLIHDKGRYNITFIFPDDTKYVSSTSVTM